MARAEPLATYGATVYLWVAVALIDSGVGAQKVIVPVAVHIPSKDALGPRQHQGQGCIVMSSIPVFPVYELRR